ncbi:hypothetical protein ACTNEO_06375 [Gracilibacillus sp. HCP3S3_G5_1]
MLLTMDKLKARINEVDKYRYREVIELKVKFYIKSYEMKTFLMEFER